MSRLLDGLSYLLVALIAWMGLTGGTILHFQNAKVEFSSLDPWVLALGVLLWIRVRLSGYSPLWKRWTGWLEKLETADFSGQKALIVLAAMLGVLFVVHCLRHWSFNTHSWDLTMVHQALFRPWGEIPLRCDLCLKGTYLGEHLSYIFYLLAPLTSWIHQDEWVFFLQVLIVGTGVYLGLKWGPLRDSRNLWLVAVLLVVCHRAFRGGLFWDFREDDIAFALLLAGLAALSCGRIWIYFVTLVLSLLAKENICWVTLFVAFPILWDRRLPLEQKQRLSLAALTVGVSLAWGIIAFRVLIPGIQGEVVSQNNIVVRMAEYGSTPAQIVIRLLTDPRALFQLVGQRILAGPALKYLLFLLGPYFFFLRLSPVWLLPTVPGILMNLLSAADTQRSFQFHYEWIILPFLIYGMWQGMLRFCETSDASQRRTGFAIALFVALMFSGRWPGAKVHEFWPDSRVWGMTRYLRSLPEHDVIAADFVTLGQLSHIRQIRELRLAEGGWDEFWKANRSDRTALAGRGAFEARVFVFDRDNPAQKRVSEMALQKSWKQISSDPSGRFVSLERTTSD